VVTPRQLVLSLLRRSIQQFCGCSQLCPVFEWAFYHPNSMPVLYIKGFKIFFFYVKESRLADHSKTVPDLEWFKQDGDNS
jgi:hypothetical protein